MITVHHLENSRSQRILWLLEELGLDYKVKRYERDKKTYLAPVELTQVHPLGKSPVIEDAGAVFAESGAIAEYLVETYGEGRLAPPPQSPDYRRYKYWLYAAEGSFMPPMVMAYVLGRMESSPMPFFMRPFARRLARGVREAYLASTADALFGYLEGELANSDWLAGAEFTAADIVMSMPIEAATQRVDGAEKLPNLKRFSERIRARPAFARASERGGP